MYKIDFARKEDVETFSKAIDKAHGLPLTGVRLGGGRHMPSSECLTLRMNVPRQDKKGVWEYELHAKVHDGKAVIVDGLVYNIDMSRAKAVEGAAADDVVKEK